jgi:hypothetical protein
MEAVMAATRAILAQFDTVRIVAPILLGGVISFPALNTFKGDYRTNTSFSRHTLTFIPILGW